MSYAYSLSQKCTGAQQLAPWPSLNLDFANGDYLTSAGFADQASVGSANFNLGVSTGATPVFTSASGATYRYSDGYLRYAPENLLTYSQDFANGAWSKIGLNSTGTPPYSNVASAPDGTITADALIANGANSNHYVYVSASRTWQPFPHSFSCYMKMNTNRYGWIGCYDGTNSYQGVFDLLNGAYVGKATSSQNITASIELISDGWYRCSVLFTPLAASASFSTQIGTTNNGSLGLVDSSSGSIYIWGAQLERHSSARPYISTVASQVFGPRFEYDTSGNPIGLLIEESSTNLLTYSEGFSNDVAWLKVAATYVGTTTAPNNTNTASTINATSTSNVVRQAATVLASTKYVFSFYVKRGTATNLKYAIYNLSALSFIIGPTSYYSSTSNEWSRIAVEFTTPAGCTSVGVYVMSDTGSTGTASFWGAQLEQKSFATSYIPTVASTASRSADTCTISGASFTGFFPAGNLSVVSAGDRIANIANSGFYDFYSLANSFTALNHSLSSGNEVITIGVATNEVISLGAASAVNVETKIAVSHDQVNLAGSRDGYAVVTTAASGGFGFTPDRVYIGYRKDDNKYLNGHISLLKVYDKSLESKLTSLSA